MATIDIESIERTRRELIAHLERWEISLPEEPPKKEKSKNQFSDKDGIPGKDETQKKVIFDKN